MVEKQYAFQIGQHITIVVQANNIPNAWQYLEDLGIKKGKAKLLNY